MFCIRVKLADITMQLGVFNEETCLLFSNFATNEDAKYSFNLTKSRIEEERAILKKNYPGRFFPEWEIESNALYHEIPKILFSENVVLFHGVLLRYEKDGYLFTAPSGIGKSTHANYWIQKFPNSAFIINGDKPFLKYVDGELFGYASPWQGKENIGYNDCVRIKAVCYLTRGTSNSIIQLDLNFDSMKWLIDQTMIANRGQLLLELFRWYRQSLSCTCLYRLECTMDPNAAVVAYLGMK